ncbi:hypothetical protein [Streptomyces sp. NPDC048338]|uniref:hypothetical protein n=1 Tax=Streptomyces sp. NPDC048338 TaxID=3365536 RepID=UPI0037209478
MTVEPVNSPIHTKYAEQLAADLAANHAEQAHLTARLNQLREEEKWLVTTRESMPAFEVAEAVPVAADGPASSAVPAAGGRDEAAVPQPRTEKTGRGAAPAKQSATRKTPAPKRTVRKTPARTTPAKRTAPARKATEAKTAEPAKAAEKTVAPQGPTLGELLKGLLSRQPGEPKKVSEIRGELEAAHPHRVTSEQVVRNALTKLVAQGALEKDNRQGVVLYTWPAASTAAAAEVAEAEGAAAGA